MSVVETIAGIIIYSFFYFYYNHSGILISFLILILLFYISSKNSGIIPNIINSIIKKSTCWDQEKSIEEQMKYYKKLSRRPRILPAVIPIIITGAIAYIILNKLVFFAIITSGSMSPTLEVKDLVLMQNLNIEPLRGDIIMFETKEAKMPVIHRIYSVSSSSIKTKGDAAQLVDEWTLKKDQIEGEAILFQGKPIIIKSIGEYLLFDPNDVRITSHGSEIYQISEFVKNIKKLGLTIFIICVLLYIFTTLTPMSSKR